IQIQHPELFTLQSRHVQNQPFPCRTEVHPREVIKRALYHNAAAVVLAHNHPSGEVTPSKADRLITERLVQALGLVDIRVPDHLIVGGSQVFSFAEHGLL
ncbi:JAB domain-containing protein, partial [Escherichia coli]|uniref:JAB domain-containing protein n=1 Tax=Escherichia coli TaxID=562 RepID=UPI000A7DE9B2